MAPTADAGAGELLYSGLVSDILIDGVWVYWSDGSGLTSHAGSISRLAKDAGASVMPQVIASAQSKPFRLVADAQAFYWVNTGVGIDPMTGQADGAIMTLARGALQPVALYDHLPQPFGLVTDGVSLYWFEGSTLYRGAKNGSGKAMVVEAMFPAAVAADSRKVYWTTYDLNSAGSRLMAWDIGAAKVVQIASLPGDTTSSGLALEPVGKHALVTVYGQGALVRVTLEPPMAPGNLQTLVTGLRSPDGVSTDGTMAFFSQRGASAGAGAVGERPLAGGPVTWLAAGLFSPGSPAVDGNLVYFAHGLGLSRAPR